jgi:protocatechuate 3,4-dioxygenase beta subunit
MPISLPPGYRAASEGVDPPYDYPPYRSSALHHPARPLHPLPQRLTELTGPVFGEDRVQPGDCDLRHWADGEAIGQPLVVEGRLRDSDGHPVPNSLIELWQANAGGRYRHLGSRWTAPLDPHFGGTGRALTDRQGRFRIITIKPGPYPAHLPSNSWRPAHIHFSVFGRAFTQRLITQMYFPGDPLLDQDPVFNSVPDPMVRERLLATYDHPLTGERQMSAYRFEIVVSGRGQTPFEDRADDE